MDKIQVQGEIKSLGWREGASGKLIGDINGLFQGYRLQQPGTSLSNTHTIELDNGTLTLTLSQEVRIRHPLPSRPPEHPFKDGQDPFEGIELAAPRLPDLPPGVKNSGPKGNMTTVVSLRVEPATSTGIFAGAQGEMNVTLAEPAVNGFMEIETDDGSIKLKFRERMEGTQVINTLWIDGAKSTGLYQGAQGELEFRVSIYPPNFAKGTYSGVIWIEGRVATSPR